jgi:hypothetical protein
MLSAGYHYNQKEDIFPQQVVESTLFLNDYFVFANRSPVFSD